MSRPQMSAVLCLVVAGLLATQAHAVVITTDQGAGADAYVRSGSFGNSNSGTDAMLLLKNRGGNEQDYSRKSYARFDLSGIDLSAVSAATLNLVVDHTNLMAASGVNVFALNDLDAGEGWGETTITWNNAPANNVDNGYGVDSARATDLGDAPLPGSAPNGTPVSFASAALTNAVKADTNGSFTLILSLVTSANVSVDLASNNNTTYAEPALVLAGAGMTWDGGGGGDQAWSQGLNWTGDNPPGPGDHATFDNTAAAAAPGTVTNIVDTDFTIGSLTYKQFTQNTKYHTTQIDSGTTLAVTDALEVNNDLTIPPSTWTTTVHSTVTGAGTLQVGSTGESTAHVLVGYNSSGDDVDTGILDMGGLAAFDAHLDHMTVGADGGPAVGTVTLAASNTVNANSIVIARDKATGTVTAPTGATVTFNVGALDIGTRTIEGGTTSGTLDLGAAATVDIDATSILLGQIVGSTGSPTAGTMHLGAANTIAADSFIVGSNKSTGTVDIAAGGTLDLGTAGDRGDLFVGHKAFQTSYTSTGTLDLSAGAAFNAYVDTLGIGVVTPAADSSGDAIGTVRLPATTMIDASAIYVGYTECPIAASSASIGTGTLSLSPGDTLTIGNAGQTPAQRADLRVGFKHTTTTTGAHGILDFTGGTFNAWLGEFVIGYNDAGDTNYNTDGIATLGTSNTILADTVRIGDTKATGTVSITPGGTLTLGSATERADLLVGHNTTGSGHPSTGTLDLSDGTFNAHLDTLAIGRSLLGNGPPTGIVTLGTTNSVDVNTIAMGVRSPDTGTLTVGGGTVTVNGSVLGGAGTSTLNLDGGTMTVAGNFAVDNLLVAKDGASATLTVGGAASIGGSGTLDIARRPATSPGTSMVGTLDLSAASSVNISTDVINLAHNYSGTTANTTGILHLCPGTNTITSDSIYVGRGKGTGTVDIASGGTLNLGTAADPADLYIGYNDQNTSKDPAESHFNMADGKLIAHLDYLVIGYKAPGAADGRGVGRLTLSASTGNNVQVNSVTLGDYQASSTDYAQGILTMDGGTFDVAGDLVRGAAGTGDSRSTVEVNGGTMTVGGDLKVDTLSVGMQARTGSLTVGGGSTVQVGASGILDIARNTGTGVTSGTLDLSAANSVSLDLDELRIATIVGNVASTTTGTLRLGASNTITATTITLGRIDGGATPATTARLYLGADNTITADTLYCGRAKSNAAIQFASSGTLALGTPASPTDLYIGINDSPNTSTTATAHMDLSGGTVTAYLDELRIGVYPGPIGTGSGLGTLTIGSSPLNDIHANTVVLGDYQSSASAGSGTLRTARGTIHFAGGTFSAGSITQGAAGGGTSIAEFNWTGGALHADTFGFDLLNTGTGTLAPGASIGTTDILASYAQGADATLEIEIDGTAFDLVHVAETATLDGMLDVLFINPPPIGATFDVLVADGGIDDLGMELGSPAGSLYMYYSIVSLGGDVEAVRLHYTPEPATMALLGLPLALLARRRRRKNR